MKPRLPFYATAVLWLFLDLLTKHWAIISLRSQPSIEIIPGFFRFAYNTNQGAAFGILNQFPQFLPFITLLLFAWMIWMARSLHWNYLGINIGAALVAGGAIGNISDRLRHGYVVDFLDFYFNHWHYPTFNLADTGICIGLGLVIFWEWRKIEKKHECLTTGNPGTEAKEERSHSGT